ncbi:MAG: phenylalanine--tRNA ligase beta subunit-related protein [Candidatus Hadarchaeum sp.]|uniref:B3/B4 domain-containing protein n=1 Tax=Candidatus Hadarchaeum sp. TaxID=2883567 RepID=UPI0031770686
MKITIQPLLLQRFPGLQVLLRRLTGLRVERESDQLQLFKEKIAEEIKRKYRLETVKDEPVFRAYRDFFWRAGIDPTKTRPAAEALIRRILAGKPLPTINTLVDSYNLASMQTGVALGAFDAGKLRGDLTLRLANKGEKFLSIGMDLPIVLNGVELVVSDEEKLIAIYPHRDSEETKVTLETRDLCLLICGAPGMEEQKLVEAAETAVEYITRFCGGTEVR